MFFQSRFSILLQCLSGVLLITPLLNADEKSISVRPNVLFLAIDDLRNDLGVLGVDHAKTPNIDALAMKSRIFTNHYVQVPTCGASRYSLWRGQYPTLPVHLSNEAILKTQSEWGTQSLPTLFRQAGYKTLSIGKLTHYPGGLTGKDWAVGPEELPGAWVRSWVPVGPWKTPQAVMHGYANGVSRQPDFSPHWEAYSGPDEAYPDAWIANDAINTLRELSEHKQSWFLGVGFIKPHLPFVAPQKWHDLHANSEFPVDPVAFAKPTWPSGWYYRGEFRNNYRGDNGRDPQVDLDYALEIRRAYAASVSYMDAQVGRVLDELQRLKLENDTIVVLWSDHGFLLGEHAIWGKHCLFERALQSPLIIRVPGMPEPGACNSTIVETVDLFPTLCELCGLDAPPDLDGKSLNPYLKDASLTPARAAFGFWNKGQRTIRTDRWRLIAHFSENSESPVVELFDYENDPEETVNHADDFPGVVDELLDRLPAPLINRSEMKRSD